MLDRPMAPRTMSSLTAAIAVAVVVGGSACSRPSTSAAAGGSADAAPVVVERATSEGWAVYPGARRLTSGHVTGAPQAGRPGPHIAWTAWFTTDTPDRVVAYHREKLGPERDATGGEWTWQSPPSPAEPERVLTVKSSSLPGHAGVSAPPGGTVVTTSLMAR